MQEGIRSSNCKTCNQEISWDAKKREALHIRGPLNQDGTMHQCSKNQNQQEITPPKTDQKSGNRSYEGNR